MRVLDSLGTNNSLKPARRAAGKAASPGNPPGQLLTQPERLAGQLSVKGTHASVLRAPLDPD